MLHNLLTYVITGCPPRLSRVHGLGGAGWMDLGLIYIRFGPPGNNLGSDLGHLSLLPKNQSTGK